ncbi:MAG TPA: hypothetical protein VF897_14500 [Roseiflexaceae bacterium]
MGRRKKQNPLVNVAQTYLSQNMPDMKGAKVKVRMLDGPPGSPRYAASAELCVAGQCPYGVTPAVASSGHCPVLDCELRHAVRLLLDRRGTVLHASRNGIHWN